MYFESMKFGLSSNIHIISLMTDTRKQQVIEKNRHIKEGSEKLWEFVLSLLDECVSRGYLKE